MDNGLYLGGSSSDGSNKHHSTSAPKRISCDGRACSSCGKCRDWQSSGYVNDTKRYRFSLMTMFCRNDWHRRSGATCSFQSGNAVSLHHRGDLCRC